MLYPGAVFHENELGGQVLTIAYPLDRLQFNVGYFNNYRRILLHEILRNLFQEKNILLGCNVPLQAYRNRQQSQTILALLNPTHDPCRRLRFFAPGLNPAQAESLDRDGVWRKTELKVQADGSLVCERELPPLDMFVLKFRT